MSISSPALYESLLSADRPVAWWGLDTADPLADDSGHGYALTAVGAPANAASLLTRGDGGASGSRDFNGTADAYYTLGKVTKVPEGPPSLHASSAEVTSATFLLSVISPGGIEVGDLLLVIATNSVQTATVDVAPSGFSLVGTVLNCTTHAKAVYRKTAVAADTVQQEVSISWSNSGELAMLMLVVRGCDPGVANLIYDSGEQVTSSATVHSTTTETHPDGSWQLVIWTKNAATTIDPYPTGKQEWAGAVNGDEEIRAVAYEQAAAGSGFRTATTTDATQLGATLITFGSPRIVSDGRLDALAATLSVHALIRPDTIVGIDNVVRKYQAWGVWLNAGVVTFGYRDGGGVDRTVAGPSVSASTTTHLLVVDDGATIHFWKDGVETTAARAGTAGYATNTNRVVVGAMYDGASYSDRFDGRLDEVAVWNAPLTSQMAATYWQAANAGTFGTQLLGTVGVGRYPRLKLEIAFASKPTAGCLVYEDVTTYWRSGSIATGHRNYELDRMEPGQAQLTLNNRNRAFDDTNASGPFYPNVKPTRAVRLRAQSATDGRVWDVFFGYTEGHPQRRPAAGKDAEVVITAVDAFKAAGAAKIADTFVRAQELSGSRLAAVFAGVAGVPYSGEAGQSEVIGDDLKGVNRLDHAHAVAETEGGVLFADGAGVVRFQDRHHRTKYERTVTATYGNGGGSELQFLNLEPQTDEARLFTAAVITPASGNVKTVTDETAEEDHFVRTKDLSTLHASDNDAQAMAEAFAHRYSTPLTRIPAVELAPSLTGATMWEKVLSHQISQRVRTVDRPLGGGTVTRDHFIEGIKHDIDPASWTVHLTLSPAELEGEYWLLGTGQLGQASGLTSTVLGW